MKIIQENECYVQGADLEHLICNDENFPTSIYFEAYENTTKLNKLNDFVKITTAKAIEYLKNSDKIMDFDYLNSLSIIELYDLEKYIKREMADVYDSDEVLNNDEKASVKIKAYKELRRREYELNQIREMIAFKKGKSKLAYPSNIYMPICEDEETNSMTIEEYASRMDNENYLKLFRKNNQVK